MIDQVHRAWAKRPIFNGAMWLSKDSRYWGHIIVYYDGFHHAFGFWWFAIGWQTADGGMS